MMEMPSNIKVESGHQVLPASLSSYLLQGPPGWHTSTLHPKLFLPRELAGLPFPSVSLAPIQLRHFGYTHLLASSLAQAPI